MPKINRKRIFISHPYSLTPHYENLNEMLQKKRYFQFYNHSVPKDQKLPGNRRQVHQKIENRIKNTSAVIVVASKHASHRPAIRKEIQLAKKYNKPVIGVRPRGQKQVSRFISKNATEIVGWNSSSIVKAIRRRQHRER